MEKQLLKRECEIDRKNSMNSKKKRFPYGKWQNCQSIILYYLFKWKNGK